MAHGVKDASRGMSLWRGRTELPAVLGHFPVSQCRHQRVSYKAAFRDSSSVKKDGISGETGSTLFIVRHLWLAGLGVVCFLQPVRASATYSPPCIFENPGNEVTLNRLF